MRSLQARPPPPPTHSHPRRRNSSCEPLPATHFPVPLFAARQPQLTPPTETDRTRRAHGVTPDRLQRIPRLPRRIASGSRSTVDVASVQSIDVPIASPV